MYACSAQWYKKRKRQAGIRKKICIVSGIVVLLLSVCFGIWTLHAAAQAALKGKETVEQEAEVFESLQAEPVSGLESASVSKPVSESEPVLESESAQIPETDAPYLIVIDAGHGGEDEGCSGDGTEEKEINLELTFLLQEKLEEMGFRVMLTRSDDTELTLAERIGLLTKEEKKADAFISIHQNSCEDVSAEGIETWFCESNEGSKRLAKLVQQYAVLYSEAKDRGIMESEKLYVIRESKIPSCLVETGFLSNSAERKNLSSESYLEKLAQGIADGIELYFYPKVMYLTFDDGPSKENTDIILDVLKERNIKATFFVIGENVEKFPETVKRIAEEGHTLGIHCYNHAYDSLYASADSFLEDFEKAKQAIYEVTGEDVWCFRFPGGSINNYNKPVYEEIIEAMTQKGYVYFDWNAALSDAVKNPVPDQLIRNAVESTLQRKKIVLLAHDNIDATAECIEDLLEAFPEYEMRPLTKEVAPIQF